MASILQSKKLCQTVYLDGQPIIAAKVEQLDPRRSVYRFELEPASFRHTIPPTVTTVIVKQQKDDWEKEFWNEKYTYDRLKELQGTIIPHLFGQGFFDGLPALILSEVVGATLFDVACSHKCQIDEEKLKAHLEQVFNAFSEYGAMYWDQKLDNFLLCDNGDCEDSKVMVVDLEQVQFPREFRPWQYLVNQGGAFSLVRDIRDTRDPGRESSPVRFWMSDSDQGSFLKNGPGCFSSGNESENIETPSQTTT